jgi:hypothetical protein
MGRPRPAARIFATVSGREYEFVRLDRDSAIEAYDHPKAWGGIPRFVGYLPAVQAAKLLDVATRAVRAVAFGSLRGRTWEFSQGVSQEGKV